MCAHGHYATHVGINFPDLILWVSGIKLRSPGLGAGILPSTAKSLPSISFFFLSFLSFSNVNIRELQVTYVVNALFSSNKATREEQLSGGFPHSTGCLLFLAWVYKIYFYLLQMHVCTHVCFGGYMCILECWHMLKENWIPQRGSQKWLWMWVVGTKFRSSGRTASTLNHWVIAPDPLNFLKTQRNAS